MCCLDVSPQKKLLILTDGNSNQASARIRAIEYVPLFEKQGYDVSLINRIPEKRHAIIYDILFPFLKRWLFLKRTYYLCVKKWDVIIVQRLYVNSFFLRKMNTLSLIIFDFDDAIYINPKQPSALPKVKNMIANSDRIVTSTSWLNKICLDLGKSPTVIPTPVDTHKIYPSDKKETQAVPTTIGWIGSYWTTSHLKNIEGVLVKLSQNIPFKFITVGASPDYKIAGINHENIAWKQKIEMEILPKIDIGIMPLSQNKYASAKGGYKLYLYMAAGIPSVASPVGINSNIIVHGENGFLADSQYEWMYYLEKLLQDREMRRKMGEKARIKALACYDREICFKEWIKVLDVNYIEK